MELHSGEIFINKIFPTKVNIYFILILAQPRYEVGIISCPYQVGDNMKLILPQVCLLFTILRPFGTKKSLKRKTYHGRHIVL